MIRNFCISYVVCIMFIKETVCKNFNCDEVTIRTALEDQNMVVDTSASLLIGTWVSERCEIKARSEYLLRTYTFNEGDTYKLVQDYYWDSSCISPKLTIIAEGNIALSDCPIDMNCHLGQIKPIRSLSVIPHDSKAVVPVKYLIRKKCPGMVMEESGQLSNHSNKWYIEISECLQNFHSYYDEFRFMRIQLRPVLKSIYEDPSLATYKIELLLGKIIGYYLLKLEESKIIKLSGQSYAVANTGNTSNYMAYGDSSSLKNCSKYEQIVGDWVSRRCEINTQQGFMRRAYSFTSNTWTAQHYFYVDEQCMKQKLTTKKSGFYAISPGQKNFNSKHMDVVMTKLFITVYDYKTSTMMSKNKACGIRYWRTSYPYNLTDDRGCLEFGYTLPTRIRDLIMFSSTEKDGILLYTAQGHPNSKKQNRYVFQNPLVKCLYPPNFPEYDENVLGEFSAATEGTFVNYIILSLIIVVNKLLS